jgi:hypothetical protein
MTIAKIFPEGRKQAKRAQVKKGFMKGDGV